MFIFKVNCWQWHIYYKFLLKLQKHTLLNLVKKLKFSNRKNFNILSGPYKMTKLRWPIFLLKDIFIVTSHGNIVATKEITHTHTISNNCMESSFFNIHILSERWGRTSCAPNSALRLWIRTRDFFVVYCLRPFLYYHQWNWNKS